MAPAVLLEYTKQKQTKRSSQDISHSKMDKPQKLSRRYPPGSAMDAERGPNVMLDSECSGRAIHADSVDPALRRSEKCISLSAVRFNYPGIPVRVIRLSKTSHSQRKELKSRLKSELEQIQMIQEKLFVRNMITAGGTNSSSLNEIAEKCNPLEQSGSHMQRGKSVISESSKRVAPHSASNSNLLLMKQCEALLKRLMTHKHGWVFNNPVDVVELNIPDYYTVIKHPMDLGTIKHKITSGSYSTPVDFAADVRLTFTNAMTYNPPNNTVHMMADTLIKFFETRWKPIEKKIASVDASGKKESQVPKSEFSGLKKPVISNVAYKIPVPERLNAKMTDEEKQGLTSCLVSVLADLPNHIIEFLRRHSGNMNQNSDEIEIDIESLGDDTLFELRKLLDDYLQERESRQQVKGDQSTLKVCSV